MNCSLPDLLNVLSESGLSPRITICIVLLLYTVVTDSFYCCRPHFFVFLLLCGPSFLVLNQKRLGSGQQWLGWTHAVNHWLHNPRNTFSSSRIKGNSVGSHQSATDSRWQFHSLLLLEPCFSSHYTCLLQHLPPFMRLSLHPLPPVFRSGFAHHHGSFSRADSIIDIHCTDARVLLNHRSMGGLPVCPLGGLLQQGGVWRSGDGTSTWAGHHCQCSFTPGSLGWLKMKERWEGS